MSLESAVSGTINSLHQFETKQKIAYQLAAKTLDIAQEQADVILELLDSATPKGKVPGTGRHLDVQG